MVERITRPSPDQVAQVLSLAQAAAATDGVYPLAEQVVLHLRHGGEPTVMHLLAHRGDQLAGYAHVDTSHESSGAAAELVVHPRARQQGLGRGLATAALAVAGQHDPAERLRVWAHGDHPGAAALARTLGFARTRVLHQLRRPLSDPVPEPMVPPGVILRAFRPGDDDEAWLAVNARAFADHPEQGRWRAEDLQLRQQEAWFDPAGFLLAERDGQVLGFHWTKVHDDPDGAIGEVYVLGVDPWAHGLGLGMTLTLAGLRHLQQRGLDQVLLYVDDSNTAAMRLYTKLGFTSWSVDVTYSHGSHT